MGFVIKIRGCWDYEKSQDPESNSLVQSNIIFYVKYALPLNNVTQLHHYTIAVISQ